MAATALVQARVEPDIKSEAEKYFADLGMSASKAIRMFYKKVAQTRAIPFLIEEEKMEEDVYEYDDQGNAWKLRPEFAASLLKIKEDIKAGRNLIKFNSNEEALAYFDKRMKRK